MTDSKVFVDTNVLVYAHDAAAGVKHEKAREIISNLWDRQGGVLSTQVLQEFYVTVTRKVTVPVAADLASRWVGNYLAWEVIANDGESIIAAIQLEQRYQLSFWDALILQAASKAGVGEVLSEDLNAGQEYGAVKVVNPFA